MLTKAKKFLYDLIAYYPPNAENIIRYLSDIYDPILHSEKRNIRVAVEGVYDPLYFGLFGIVISELKKNVSIRTDFIWIHSVSNAIGVGLVQSVLRSQLISFLRCRQWYRAYRIFTDDIAYCSNTWLSPLSELKIQLRARRIYKEFRTHPSLADYVVDGVIVGDLIIDSFLRFRPSPQFDVSDRFVKKLIRQVLRDIYKAERYFKKRKPCIYLTSYTTYIQHGLPVRVALKYGVEVRCFPGALNFGKKLSHADFYHSLNCENYRSEFANLGQKNLKLHKAEVALNDRFSGKRDIATNYMRVSAYATSDIKNSDFKGHVVIFLHDFYDSPHFYSNFIFVDFWSWLTYTIDILIEFNIKFLIKPHPNQIPESDRAFKSLISQYPGVRVLPDNISNLLLVDSGIICGITAYGTVAHELAYFGIPSITCANHPHHKYDFCRTARSLVEYREFLKSPGVLPVSVDKMKKQALEFVYMLNFNVSDNDQVLREKVATFFSAFNESSGYNEIVDCLAGIHQAPGFSDFINDVGRGIS